MAPFGGFRLFVPHRSHAFLVVFSSPFRSDARGCSLREELFAGVVGVLFGLTVHQHASDLDVIERVFQQLFSCTIQ